MMTRLSMIAIFIFASGLPAAAHTAALPSADVLAGFAHPLTGVDHLAAMLGLGLWAAVMGGLARWVLPVAFLCGMAFGGAFAHMTGAAFPLPEAAILVSALLLPAFALLRVRLRLPVAAALTVVFALAHGHAHGLELPAGASSLLYASGFLAATAALHWGGVALAHLTSRTDVRPLRTTS
jgi:urease accessory protein